MDGSHGGQFCSSLTTRSENVDYNSSEGILYPGVNSEQLDRTSWELNEQGVTKHHNTEMAYATSQNKTCCGTFT